MVDTKKEQEREELHRAIWAIADDPAWRSGRMGFQELRSRYDVLPLYFGEHRPAI